VIRPALARGAVVLCDRFTGMLISVGSQGKHKNRFPCQTLETILLA